MCIHYLNKNSSHKDNEIINEWNLSYQLYFFKTHRKKKIIPPKKINLFFGMWLTLLTVYILQFISLFTNLILNVVQQVTKGYIGPK